MTVLIIRAHHRFAMRLPVKLRQAQGKPARGLLIEISKGGARVSNLGASRFEVGEQVELITNSGSVLRGSIRWAHDGLAGICHATPLHAAELAQLLDENRRGSGELEPRYGT